MFLLLLLLFFVVAAADVAAAADVVVAAANVVVAADVAVVIASDVAVLLLLMLMLLLLSFDRPVIMSYFSKDNSFCLYFHIVFPQHAWKNKTALCYSFLSLNVFEDATFMLSERALHATTVCLENRM